MEDFSRLQESFDVLLAEMGVLKYLREDIARRGDPKMDRWLQNVKAQDRNVEELQKELSKIDISISRFKLKKKVIESLQALADLKREGNCNVVAHRVGVSGSSETIESFLSQMEGEKPLRFSSRQLTSFTLDFSSRLGFGAYGEVFKGQFPNGVQLAVKVLKGNGWDAMKRQFMAEVTTMGRTYHRNLVRLYGFCFDTNMKALVYEYMENGSLDNILYDNTSSIEWEKLYFIAIETAKGLSYLHDNCHKRIIHYDIKTSNVLIDSNHCPRLSDFGLAKLCSLNMSHVNLTGIRGRGTRGYVAPEVLSLQVTYKCDVYSFGIMLFEILGRKRNRNSHLDRDQKWFPILVWEKFEKGKLEEIMTECGIEEKDRDNAKKLCMVALWCVQFVPQARPSMSTVVKILQGGIQAMVPPNPFAHMASPNIASMLTVDCGETMSSLISSKFSTPRDGDSTRTGGPTPTHLSSSEVSLAGAECVQVKRQVELQAPFHKPTVEVEKKIEEVIAVVLIVYMHCEACGREIKKYLMKMKGVQSAAVDLESSQLTVKGTIDPGKLVEYIYEKTNKRAMILENKWEKTEEENALVETEPKTKSEKKEGVGIIKTKEEEKETKKIKEFKGFLQIGVGKKDEEPEEGKGHGNRVYMKTEKSRRRKEEINEAKPEEAKPIKEGTEVEVELKKNEFYQDPPKYVYSPQMGFTNKNPHSWCSIQ